MPDQRGAAVIGPVAMADCPDCNGLGTPRSMAGHCFDIDGGRWHDVGACRSCRPSCCPPCPRCDGTGRIVRCVDCEPGCDGCQPQHLATCSDGRVRCEAHRVDYLGHIGNRL